MSEYRDTRDFSSALALSASNGSIRGQARDLDDLPILDIYRALGGETAAPKQYRGEDYVRCLRHKPDKHPSLRLHETKGVFCCGVCGKDEGGGKLQLVVFAGQARDEKDAMRWLVSRGLLAEYSSDAFTPARKRRESVRSSTVASWHYTDEDGAPFARIDRVEPGRFGKSKDFFPHVWTGEKYAAQAGLDGKKLPLYRLPEVRRAIAAGERVFFTEGEGKGEQLGYALLAAEVEATVTTVPGGCGASLTDEHLDQLRGLKSAVVLADSDTSGRTAARLRAERIARALGAEVKVLDFYPEATTKEHPAWASDVADWLTAGGTVEQLRALVESAPIVEPSTVIVAEPEEEDEEDDAPEWPNEKEAPWPAMDPEAFHGLTGDLIREIQEQTEANPVALLLTLLVAFGSAAGLSSYIVADRARHPARLFVVLVGGTSTGRKGTSFGVIADFLKCADEEWFNAVHRSGFLSGEAIIADLAGELDKVPSPYPKQAFVIEPEIARLLAVNNRDGSTTSPIIRDAWDGGVLSAIRRAERTRVEGANLCILGHISPEELAEKLTSDQIYNGLANRFLFVCVRRSRKLSSGGYIAPEIIARYGKRLRVAMDFAREGREMKRTPAAEVLWDKLYQEEPEDDGLLGAFTARGPAQMLRLSVAYALLDRSPVIDVPHLKAAAAVWRYCRASVSRRIDLALSPDEKKLLDELRRLRREMTAVEIDRFFQGNRSAKERGEIVGRLVERKLATKTKAPTGGAFRKPASLVRALTLSEYGFTGFTGDSVTTRVSPHLSDPPITDLLGDRTPEPEPEPEPGASKQAVNPYTPSETVPEKPCNQAISGISGKSVMVETVSEDVNTVSDTEQPGTVPDSLASVTGTSETEGEI